MTYEEWVNAEIGPRVVGGRYDHGFDASAYEVIEIDRGPRTSGPTWQMTVRGRDGVERTHCTRWDARRDRVRVADQSIEPQPVGPGVDTVEVDPGDGIPQRWTGATWNDRLACTRRTGDPFFARVIRTYPEVPGQGQPL
ncbi:hypothetical protein ACWDBD_37150 [Streptomyces sp. NPDC001118]